LPFRIITLDNAEALESVYKLARLPIKVICFGHGKPILDGAGAQLKAFLDKHQSKP
jgi:glyoxylase-like metal-dependent hydrolase (beta-lactamase superfamily II)